MNHILRCHKIEEINFVRGENCYLYDENGKKYIDFIAGCWSTALGHNNTQINKVMKSQIDKLIHLGWRYPNKVVESASVEVLNVLGIPDGKCVFLSSGSEAVELGIKIVRHIINEPKLLKFSSSYLSAFSSSVNKNSGEWQQLDWNLYTDKEPKDYQNDLSFDKIGGFVFEPGGSGSESVRFPSSSLVQHISNKIKEKGGLLISNEITTGFGRTGTWFGFQNYNLQPDIIAMGKCLGNGYPVSAVAMTKEVADRVEKSNFHHVQSHQNDPLGCAIAKEVITVLKNEAWITKGNLTGTYFLECLKRLKDKHNLIKDVRGKGMLLALEVNPFKDFTIERLYQELFNRGFLIMYSQDRNFLRFDPSLTISRNDIDNFVECLDAILTEFEK